MSDGINIFQNQNLIFLYCITSAKVTQICQIAIVASTYMQRKLRTTERRIKEPFSVEDWIRLQVDDNYMHRSRIIRVAILFPCCFTAIDLVVPIFSIQDEVVITTRTINHEIISQLANGRHFTINKEVNQYNTQLITHSSNGRDMSLFDSVSNILRIYVCLHQKFPLIKQVMKQSSSKLIPSSTPYTRFLQHIDQ